MKKSTLYGLFFTGLVFTLPSVLTGITAAQAQPADDPLINPLPDPALSQLGLVLEEFVTLPRTEPVSGDVYDNRLMRHNRINHLSELPDGSGRLAVPDLNGPLYILLDDGSYHVYLDMSEYFPDLHNHAGLGTGFGFVAFHPEFGQNGTFYTVHTESGNALQTRQLNGENNDWKSGIFDAAGINSLGAFNQADAVSIAGWFRQTGQNPSPGFGATGLAGLLSGTSEGHLVRALLEVFEINGEQRLVALGRRLDDGTSLIYASDIPWHELMPQNEWVHLAATFDFDTGDMRLFANGSELSGTYTDNSNVWAVTDTEPDFTSATDPAGIKIGGSFPQNTAEQNPCNCRMDDLMFLNKALSAEEVSAQYLLFLETEK